VKSVKSVDNMLLNVSSPKGGGFGILAAFSLRINQMKLFFESAKICEICGLKRFFDLAMAGFFLCFLSVPMLVLD